MIVLNILDNSLTCWLCSSAPVWPCSLYLQTYSPSWLSTLYHRQTVKNQRLTDGIIKRTVLRSRQCNTQLLIDCGKLISRFRCRWMNHVTHRWWFDVLQAASLHAEQAVNRRPVSQLWSTLLLILWDMWFNACSLYLSEWSFFKRFAAVNASE